MTHEEFFWDRIKHEENLFTTRANFFLVGESMLLAAVAALFASNSAHTSLFILCGVGGISTGIWMFVNYLQRKRAWNPARDALRKLGAEHPNEQTAASAYHGMQHASERGPLKRLKSHVLMGYIVPALLLLGWVSLALEIPFRRDTGAAMITPERIGLVVLFILLIFTCIWFERRLRRIERELIHSKSTTAVTSPPNP